MALDKVVRPTATVRNSRHRVLLLVKLAVSLSMVAYVFWKADLRSMSLSKSVIVTALFCGALLAAQPLIIALRWWTILAALGDRTSLSLLNRYNWMAVFANQILPASIGSDLLRVALASRMGVRTGRVIVSVLLDRAFSLTTLLILVAGSLPALIGVELVSGTPLIIALSLAALAGGFMVSGVIARLLQPHYKSRPWLRPFAAIAYYTAEVARQPATVVQTMSLSAVVHALSLGSLILIARSFGVGVPIWTLAAIGLLVMLVHILPISIGGWGARELAAIVLFGNFGVSAEIAAAISIALGVGFVLASLPGLVFWMIERRQGTPFRTSADL